MRICKCCGKNLPIDNFIVGGFGRFHTCKECVSEKRSANHRRKVVEEKECLQRQQQEARSLRLRDFQPRELMIELKRRGYEGTLTYTEVKTIDITKVD